MTTTKLWLENATAGGADIVYSLVVEGYNYVATTGTASEIVTAFSGTDWTVVKGGLQIVGVTSQEIRPFDQTLEPDSLRFTVVDIDDALAGTMLREGNSSAVRSYLASTGILASSTTVAINDTTDFAASGTVYVGLEPIAYTSKTGAPDHTLNGCTRGKWSLFGTSSDATRYGHPHPVSPTVTAGINRTPEVTDVPRCWYNRTVALYAHHREDGVLATKANAHLVYAGRIKSYTDKGDGTIEIETRSVKELLLGSVFREQYRAKVHSGQWLLEANASIGVHVTDFSGGTSYGPTYETLAGTGELNSYEDLETSISSQLSAWSDDGASDLSSGRDRWTLSMTGSNRYEVRLSTTSAINTGDHVAIALAPSVWNQLGFTQGGTFSEDPDGNQVVWHKLSPVSSGATTSSTWVLRATKAPLVYTAPGNLGDYVVVDEPVGTWVSQGTVPGNTGDADGFIQVDDLILAVLEDSGSFRVEAVLDPDTRLFTTDLDRGAEILGGRGDSFRRIEVRLETGNEEAPTVKQIWYEIGSAGDLFAKLILSTGDPTYNHASLDVYTGVGMGLGIPYTMVDVDSFLDLDAPNELSYTLYLPGPTPFTELLEPVLKVTNRHVVWRNGKLTLVRAGYESTDITSAYALTESNKASQDKNNPQRTTVNRGVEGVINRVVVKYGRRFGTNDYRYEIPVNDLTSQSDFKSNRTLSIEAGGLNPDSVEAQITNTIAAALVYFSRPLAVAERTVDASTINMVPGDLVLLTDSAVVDPRTGERGVTELPCWVMSTSFDWSAMCGMVRLVFLPELQLSKVGYWAPSAYITGHAAGVITCSAHRFSHTSQGVDVSYFTAGDAVHVYELDAASPQEWTRTVSSVNAGANQITLSSTLSGFDSSKKYVIEFDDINSVGSTQREKAFIADDSTRSTGYVSEPKPYRWGDDAGAASLAVSAFTSRASNSLAYNIEFCRPADSADNQGEPLSTHKLSILTESLNNLLGYKTCNVVNDWLPSEVSQTGTSAKVYGPIFLPVYSLNRDIKIRLYVKVGAGDTGVYTVKSSTAPITATSATAFTYPHPTASVSVNATNTSYAWTSELTLSPRLVLDANSPGAWYTWITIEYKGSVGGDVAYLRGWSIREENL